MNDDEWLSILGWNEWLKKFNESGPIEQIKTCYNKIEEMTLKARLKGNYRRLDSCSLYIITVQWKNEWKWRICNRQDWDFNIFLIPRLNLFTQIRSSLISSPFQWYMFRIKEGDDMDDNTIVLEKAVFEANLVPYRAELPFGPVMVSCIVLYDWEGIFSNKHLFW